MDARRYIEGFAQLRLGIARIEPAAGKTDSPHPNPDGSSSGISDIVTAGFSQQKSRVTPFRNQVIGRQHPLKRDAALRKKSMKRLQITPRTRAGCSSEEIGPDIRTQAEVTVRVEM